MVCGYGAAGAERLADGRSTRLESEHRSGRL